MSQSAENTDKNNANQLALLNSLINTSDFQSVARRQPASSRNRIGNHHGSTSSTSQHILISGDGGGQHSRHQSHEGIPNSSKSQQPYYSLAAPSIGLVNQAPSSNEPNIIHGNTGS